MEIDRELQKFWAAYQPDKSSKALEEMVEIFSKWGKSVKEGGSGDFQDSIKSLWSQLDEWFFVEGTKGINRSLLLGQLPKELTTTIKKAFSTMFKGEGLSGLASFANAFMINLFALKGYFHTVSRGAEQVANQRQPNKLVDIESLIIQGFRSGDDATAYASLIKYGFDNEKQIVLNDTRRPILSLGEIQSLYQRTPWKKEKTLGFLHQLGYPKSVTEGSDKATTEYAYLLLRPVLPVADILELDRRGLLDTGELESELARHGFNSHMQGGYKGLKERLIDVNQLSEAKRRGYYDQKDWLKRMGKLGFLDTDETVLSALTERLPDFYLARTLWWRGEIDDLDYISALRDLGYNETNAKRIKEVSHLLPTPQDLMLWGKREIFHPEIRKEFGMDQDFPKTILPLAKKIGLSEETTRNYWAAHWTLPSPGQGYDLFHRGEINEGELVQLLRALDIMPKWQKLLLKLSYRLIPRRTLPRLIKQGLIDLPKLKQRFRALGYNDIDADIMAKSALMQGEEPEKNLTRSDIIDDYVYENTGSVKLRERLKVLGYNDTQIDLIYAKALRKRALYLTVVKKKTVIKEAPAAKELTKNEVLRMYKERVVTEERASRLLRGINISRETIVFLLAFADLQRAREIRESHADQVKRLFDRRLITDTKTLTQLTLFGYSDVAANKILDFWKLVRDTDETIADAKFKNPTRTDVNDWLKKGIIDVLTWQTYMTDMKYSRDDTARYLMELAIDTAKK